MIPVYLFKIDVYIILGAGPDYPIGYNRLQPRTLQT
jgi:hypothetical protein